MSQEWIELDLQEGPQRLAGESPATIIIYGGAAGSGKSRWLTHELAKFFDTPGYGACAYRRTYGELTAIGGLCEEMEQIYPHLGGTVRDSKHEWKFPVGAKVCWGQMEHVATSLRHLQGTQFTCIGLDEVTHFEEKQFWMAFSRLRTMSGVRTRLLATCNPDPDSWVRRLIDWWIGPDGYPIQERSGVLRWFKREKGELKWFDSEAECVEAGGQRENSLTFISAHIWDNPALMAKDPGYLAKLKALPPVEQARFLGGNWDTRESAGDMFQELWFPRLYALPLSRKLAKQPPDVDIIQRVRVWDFASTPFLGDLAPGILRPADFRARSSGDPDWTRGLLVERFRDGRIVVRDMVSCRDTPGAVQELLLRVAEKDGPNVDVAIWQDPGQAGVYQIDDIRRKVEAKHRRFHHIAARLDKADYAAIGSRTAYQGRIFVIEKAPWAGAFFRELENFPEGAHDDIVDCLSLAMVFLLENLRAQGAPKRVQGYRYDKDKERTRNDIRLTARFASL